MSPLVLIEEEPPVRVKGTIVVNTAGGENDSNGTTDIFLPKGVKGGDVEKLVEASDRIIKISRIPREWRKRLRVDNLQAEFCLIPRDRGVAVHSLDRVRR